MFAMSIKNILRKTLYCSHKYLNEENWNYAMRHVLQWFYKETHTLKFNHPRRSPTYDLSLFSNDNTVPTFVRYILLNISRTEQMSVLWLGQFFL